MQANPRTHKAPPATKKTALPCGRRHDTIYGMKDCRITVMRIVRHTDLMEEYENPMENACGMREGMTFISEGARMPRRHVRERVGEHETVRAGACMRRRGHLRRLDEKQEIGNDLLQRRLPPRKFLYRGARKNSAKRRCLRHICTATDQIDCKKAENTCSKLPLKYLSKSLPGAAQQHRVQPVVFDQPPREKVALGVSQPVCFRRRRDGRIVAHGHCRKRKFASEPVLQSGLGKSGARYAALDKREVELFKTSEAAARFGIHLPYFRYKTGQRVNPLPNTTGRHCTFAAHARCLRRKTRARNIRRRLRQAKHRPAARLRE